MFHKLRGYISVVIITGVSICLHLLPQFPEYLQAWQHTVKDQSPATTKFQGKSFLDLKISDDGALLK
jgi:hypothetical protein